MDLMKFELVHRNIWNSPVVLQIKGSYVVIISFVVVRRNSCPVARSEESDKFIINLSSAYFCPGCGLNMFVLLFCRAALGNPPQAAYSSFPLQSAGEFCECVQ